ncbi:MAG TPA: endonuclease/exonuclease/phosphatase [Cyanothece sp. UBA12306]|nr:endonuclease/exonuclease/phosphatase [Cyanothece sp. UBA12306]
MNLSFFKNILNIIILLSIIALTIISLVSYKFGKEFILELFSHFQLQYFLLSIILLFFLLSNRPSKFVLIALIFTTINSVHIIPWHLEINHTINHKTTNLKLLTFNVHKDNKKYFQTIQFVKKEQPDLVAFIETTPEWHKKLELLGDTWPYICGKYSKYAQELIVYSKQELKDCKIEQFAAYEKLNISAKLTINKQTISLIVTHPQAPISEQFFAWRNQQLDSMAKYIKNLDKPIIVMGDLNITMWSPYYEKLISSTNLKNARQGFGILPTWPTQNTYSLFPKFLAPFLSIPIDHYLISPNIQVVNLKTGPNIGSDHRPLVAELFIK